MSGSEKVLEMIKKTAIARIIFCIVVFAIIGIATNCSSPSSAPTEAPQQENNLPGLSEVTRIQIYTELVICQQEGDQTAMRSYFPGCESCPEFIEANLDKYSSMSTEAFSSCMESVISKYNVTEDTVSSIVVEGIESKWQTPDYLAIPDCCGPQSASTTQSSQVTIEEQNYLTSISEISSTLINSLGEYSSLVQNYQTGDDAWTLQVVAQMVIIRGEYEKTVNLVPPDSLTNVHNKFYSGMSCFNDMTYLFTEGADNMDPDLINEATVKVNEGKEYIVEAIGLMNDFNAAHGL